jgi:polyisoprenoid-binding protein YceI
MTATQTIPQAATRVWEIDPAHSSAQFSVRHLMISNVKGEFTKVSGRVSLDEDAIERASVEAVVDVATISTREPDRDAHLKSPDFFDVANFPVMTFKSRRVEKNSGGILKLTGDLTLRGTTRPVTFRVEGPSAPVKDPWGKVRRGASATAKINRKDFGLTWNAALETGGFVVGDEVSITLDIELVEQAAASAAVKN